MLCAVVAMVLNQEGDICRKEGTDAVDLEEHEMRRLVKRVVLQRQQGVDDEGSDFEE
jgi:hypothetical protein